MPTTVTGSNLEVEKILKKAKQGMYVIVSGIWGFTASDGELRYSCAAKIVEATQTKVRLFSDILGNLRIEFPDGTVHPLYAPKRDVKRSVNAGGYAFVNSDRQISDEVKAKMAEMRHIDVSRYGFRTSQVQLLNPEVLQEKEMIVRVIEEMRSEEERYQQQLLAMQKKAEEFKAQQAAREEALKGKMDKIDLDEFFKS